MHAPEHLVYQERRGCVEETSLNKQGKISTSMSKSGSCVGLSLHVQSPIKPASQGQDKRVIAGLPRSQRSPHAVSGGIHL